MQTFRSTSRRSFLSQVAGGGLIAGAVLFVGARRAVAQQGQGTTRRMVVDADPRDPARAPSPPSPSRPADSDSGASSDTTGRGKPARASAQAPERFVVCPGSPRCPS